jgi:D-serine deaminase-like pyridoxal phosphate-dependent protein
LRGVQAYGGHLQHIEARAQREEAAARLRDVVASLVARLGAERMPAEIVTGVGTGTHDRNAAGGVFCTGGHSESQFFNLFFCHDSASTAS